MSQTITISDELFSRLKAMTSQRGLDSIEQLLESWPVAQASLTRFQELAKKWKQETAHLSNIAKKAVHPAYQEIIGMGAQALPLVLAELKYEPNDWFWALNALTGENPIPAESRGNLQAMAKAWHQWGLEQGYDV